MKKLTKQTVYLPVKVEDEQKELQQEIDYWYGQTGSLTSETIIKRAYSLGLGKGIEAAQGYFFTPEQLNEYTATVIRQALETAAENAEVDFEGYDKEFVNKKSIINTFEEIFKQFEV